MGAWKTDASLAIRDEVFIPIVVRIMNRARAPLQRFFFGLEKGEEDILLDGNERRCGLVAQMVWSKANDVLSELDQLTFICGWSDIIAAAPAPSRAKVVDCILLITVQHYADFRRRVVRLMDRPIIATCGFTSTPGCLRSNPSCQHFGLAHRGFKTEAMLLL